MRLKNKHILITGGAKRIGRHLAETFISHGANLSIHYRSSKVEAEGVVNLALSQNRKAVAVQADLKDTASIKTAVAGAIALLGPIDILINGASDFYPTPTLELTDAQWDAFLDINLRGQFFFAQACLPEMMKRGAGVIVNIADVHGERAIRGYMPYSVSKAGLLMMTRNLAREFAPKVRVNSISPGPVLLPPHYDAAQLARSIKRTLLQRVGSPEDIAQAALFLIENDYITGENLRVDGGRSLT